MRTPAWEPWSAVAAAVVLAASVGLVHDGAAPGRSPPAGAERPVGTPGRAGAGTPVAWSAVWIDDSNPFVPWQLRTRAGADLATGAILPPGQQADVVGSQPIPERLPPRVAGGGGAPAVQGFLRRAGGVAAVRVHLPGATGWCDLLPGAQRNGWTLLAVESGNAVRFRSPEGRELVVLIAGVR